MSGTREHLDSIVDALKERSMLNAESSDEHVKDIATIQAALGTIIVLLRMQNDEQRF